MKIVVDTNVFISAFLKTSSVPALAVQLVCREHAVLKSTDTEQEIRRVISRPHLQRYIDSSAHAWLDSVLAMAESVEVKKRITVCRDPMDDKFLELAVNGGADLVISGDKDLISMTSFEGIPIITPAIFIKAFYA